MLEKTLLTCSPKEFLVQTNRMKKAVEKWVTATEIKSIIGRKPEGIEALTGDETKDAEIKARNAERTRKNGLHMLSDIMDEALEKHTDETLEIIAMMFFHDAETFNAKYQPKDFLFPLYEMLNDKGVTSFFMSFVGVARTFTER